ncbi:deoxyribodipyrimidine photo-lyase [Sulfuritalea sp.]
MPAALVWFRRDLRGHDHAALHRAARGRAGAVLPASTFCGRACGLLISA